MKSFIQIAFLLVAFASLSFAAVGFGFYKNDKYPGKCVISEKVILSPGESAPHPDFCGQYICQEHGLAQIQSCGAQGPSEGCVLGVAINPTAVYPDCCDRKEIC